MKGFRLNSVRLFLGGIICSIVVTGCAHIDNTSSLPATASDLRANVLRQPNTGDYSSLYSFGENKKAAAIPMAGLLYSNGRLYGTTTGGGGPTDAGTVFEMSAAGAVHVIYSFEGGPNGNLTDGYYPSSRLVAMNGKLYGTTLYYGHIRGLGTVFEVDPSTGKERVLHRFGAADDGATPGGMIDANGKLYGTTNSGGTWDYGTIYEIDPSSGAERVLYSFGTASNDGRNPGGLLAIGGTLYGIAGFGGGSDNCGTVFAFNPSTGKEHIIYSFKGNYNGSTDGWGPSGSLVEVKGKLYGTTALGGSAKSGTVFTIDPATGKERVLYSFSGGSDGLYPNGLIVANGALYGSTNAGGLQITEGSVTVTGGVVYEMTTSGDLGILHEFKGGDDGMWPLGGVVAANNALYGTTESGGGYSAGTAYRILLSSKGSR